jgi:hypothetical protein
MKYIFSSYTSSLTVGSVVQSFSCTATLILGISETTAFGSWLMVKVTVMDVTTELIICT